MRGLDRLRHHAVGHGLAFLPAHLLHHRLQAIAREDAHQVVFGGDVELGAARIALAARAAAQLVVDAAGFVALRAEHVEAARVERLLLLGGDLFGDLLAEALGLRFRQVVGHLLGDAELEVAPELDVGAAPRHVGGDGDRAHAARLGDDGGFLVVEAGVEHLVRDAAKRCVFGHAFGDAVVDSDLVMDALRGFAARLQLHLKLAIVGCAVAQELRVGQELRERLGLLDRGGADQHGLAALGALHDLVGDGDELLAFGAVDLVLVVHTLDRAVGGDFQHFELVDLEELGRLGQRRARHA